MAIAIRASSIERKPLFLAILRAPFRVSTISGALALVTITRSVGDTFLLSPRFCRIFLTLETEMDPYLPACLKVPVRTFSQRHPVSWSGYRVPKSEKLSVLRHNQGNGRPSPAVQTLKIVPKRDLSADLLS